MKKIILWIVKKLIKDWGKTNNLKVRSQYGALEGWVSIIGNIILFLVKIVAGLITKSISLIADAIHTLSDCITSIVIIVGFKIAKKPSDEEHPFGHGRIEYVTTLIVAVLLFVAGFELFKKSIHNILSPESINVSNAIILLISSTIIIKEIMARFSFILGEMIDSQALKADGIHHRTDAFSTILVVIALISSKFGFNYVDGIMGVLVSLIIFYSAYEIGKEAINPLLGESPSKETLKSIEKLAKKHKGVLGVHDIIFHKYGSTNIISLHIEVSSKEDVMILHELSEDVEDEIVKKFEGMAVVHIDPVNNDHQLYEPISKTIEHIIFKDKRIDSFHDLRIVGIKKDKCNVVFDICLSQQADEQETYDIINSIEYKLKEKFPNIRTVIKVEPRYCY